LLLGFRRGVLVLVPLLILPGPADAGVWDDLWLRPDQQAYRELQQGQPEHAAALFEDPDWSAAALYRSGEYERAAEAYAAAAQRATRAADADANTALYNEANARARLGDYAGAIARYDTVLERDPEHSDARANRALMEKLLAEQPGADPDAPQNQAPQTGNRDDQAQSPQQSSDAETAQQRADAGGQQDEQRGERETDDDAEGSPRREQSEESEAELADQQADRDALEQWLRRVPDDPGGLLRRKFQYETNQRLRQGEFRARDPEKIW
jgi:Ca-activated chloride channel family protein